MTIRPATAQDASALAQIENRQPFSAHWGTEGFVNELQIPSAHIWCAVQDGTPIGFAALRMAAGLVEILNVSIAPAYCRKGYGFALLSHALTQARAHGAQDVTLEVNSLNAPAIALYKKLGFKEMGLRKNFYHNAQDALIMGISL